MKSSLRVTYVVTLKLALKVTYVVTLWGNLCYGI
jgi:hypothetical protein